MLEDSYAPDAASASPGAAPVAKVSLRRVEELAAWFDSHLYDKGTTESDTAAALEALVRLVEAGNAVSAQDAGEGLFSDVDWREMNALTAALAQFTDDRGEDTGHSALTENRENKP